MRNIDRYKEDLDALIELGEEMKAALKPQEIVGNEVTFGENIKVVENEKDGRFEEEYQHWYTESSEVIKLLIRSRFDEFNLLYEGDRKRKGPSDINVTNYSIKDWLLGLTPVNVSGIGKQFDEFPCVVMNFKTQLGILKSVKSRFESKLFEIRQLVQADLFDSELGAARELLKHDFVRGAGAIAGVVLEKHLAQVAENYDLTIRRSNPSINDLNVLLKNEGVLGTASWRQIQYLGDVRNRCVHNKESEPTNDEVKELIDGVEKFTKTLF